jgi:hypothetical protein
MSGVSDLSRHVAILRDSYRWWTGRDLIPSRLEGGIAVQWLDEAPFALVSHGKEADPVFNYANHAALQLFEMSWDTLTALPSRLSAGAMDRIEREHLLEQVVRDGYIADYSGIRIAASGRQFRIVNATVWNLLDERGECYGQAAMIPKWEDVRK